MRARQDLAGPLAASRSCYEPQIANAVTVTVPPPCTVTSAVPIHAVPPAFGAEAETAPRAPDPCVTVAPPPSNFVPAAQVAVEDGDDVPIAGLPVVEAGAPVTTVVLPIRPAGP